MAITKSKATARRAPVSRKSSRGWKILLLLAVLAAGALWYFRAPIGGYTGAGAAYSARVACSCVYVGGRSLDDCKKDKLAGMEMISLKEDTGSKSVTARFPLIATETATYQPGYGCVLEQWRD